MTILEDNYPGTPRALRCKTNQPPGQAGLKFVGSE
jgi:hypothetical protein